MPLQGAQPSYTIAQSDEKSGPRVRRHPLTYGEGDSVRDALPTVMTPLTSSDVVSALPSRPYQNNQWRAMSLAVREGDGI